jgi:hypothetical protein
MTSWNKGIPMSEAAKLKRKETDAARKAKITYTEKICKECSELKPLSNFSKRKDSADGHQAKCKPCESKRKAKYKWTREQFWEYDIKKQFGLDKEGYLNLLESQKNCCAICGIHKDDYAGVYGKGKKVKNFSVDHCHETNKIRGLLCFRCNLALGYAQDNPVILEKAASYIKERQ